ncbi:MAG: GNAT family protein [Bacteroidales bacterium]
MICRATDGQPVGTIDLFEFDPHHLRAGIGILIAEQSDRRKGYASMALEALVDYCFSHLKLHQVYCTLQLTTWQVKLFSRVPAS